MVRVLRELAGLRPTRTTRAPGARVGALALMGLAACTTGDAEPAVTMTQPQREAVVAFQAGVVQPDGLQGGAPSRGALVRAYVEALAGADTAMLRGLALSRAEFAYLYLPTARLSLPPYELPPDLHWMQLDLQNERSLRPALERFQGRKVVYLGHSCEESHHNPRREGLNTIWGFCTTRLSEAGTGILAVPLFGLIVERGGRYKFVGYANKL